MDLEDNTVSNLLSIKISAMEHFLDKCAEDGYSLFASFEIFHNAHPVSSDLLKDIATRARKNLDISKPTCLHGL